MTGLPESPALSDLTVPQSTRSMLSSGDESSADTGRGRAGGGGTSASRAGPNLLTSRANALWGKVRRDMDAAGALGTLLSEVRRRDLEGLYEKDWCESTNEPEKIAEST